MSEGTQQCGADTAIVLVVCHDSGDLGITGLICHGVVGHPDQLGGFEGAERNHSDRRCGQRQRPLADVGGMDGEKPHVPFLVVQRQRQRQRDHRVVVIWKQTPDRHRSPV